MIDFFRGPRDSYSILEHSEGIYFATDTLEIIHNGLSFSGAIPPDLSELIAKAEANRVAIEILNGSSEGSIQKQINNAIDEFANQISDDGTINTFKELLEFTLKNSGELGTLLVLVNELKSETESQKLRLDTLETEKASLLLKIEENSVAIANLSQEIDNKIDTAFSWQNVN